MTKIGILSQVILKGSLLQYHTELKGRAYIGSSYVTYVEEAGAEAVLIDCRLDEAQLRHIYDSIDGLFLPGGGADLNNSDYARAARLFIGLSTEQGARYFPIFGICLGFQMLLKCFAEKDVDVLARTCTRETNLPVTSIERQCRMFFDLTNRDVEEYTTHDVTFHQHFFSFTTEMLERHPWVKETFNMTATTVDHNNYTFYSAFEGKSSPLYGVIWHPEKNAHEEEYEVINHNQMSKALSRKLMLFFKKECDSTKQTDKTINDGDFSNQEDKTKNLLNNDSYEVVPNRGGVYIKNLLVFK